MFYTYLKRICILDCLDIVSYIYHLSSTISLCRPSPIPKTEKSGKETILNTSCKNNFSPNSLLKIACQGKIDILKAFSTSEGSGQEELPHVRGQGWQPRWPGCDSTGAAERSNPTPGARVGSWEEQPHVQGVVAALAQEGLEELFHVQGQEGWW